MSATAEANPVTAVLTKLALMYGTPAGEEESFVSFPLTAVPMTTRDLDFVQGRSDLPEDERRRLAANFATLVNRVPTADVVWQNVDTHLWDEYSGVFTGMAEWAWGDRSEEEDERLREAHETADQLRETYREHQTAYREAQKALTHARVTADHAEDPEVADRAREKIDQLEAQKVDAHRAWVEHGHKHEYEAATETIDRLAQSGPSSLRDRWENQFTRAQRTELYSNARVYRTSYWPDDFADADDRNWTTVTLDDSEVVSLCRTAEEELPELTTSGLVANDLQADLDIERLSVDITTIDVRRPWFDATLLQSGTWRWRFDSEPFSDGGDPPRGRLPAYVTELVFARDLTLEVEPGETTETIVEHLQEGALRNFGPIPLEQPASTVSPSALGRIGSASFDPAEAAALHAFDRELTTASPDTAASGSSADEPSVPEAAVDELVATEPRLREFGAIVAGNNLYSGATTEETESSTSNATNGGSESTSLDIEFPPSVRPVTTIDPVPLEPFRPFDPSVFENIPDDIVEPGEYQGQVTKGLPVGTEPVPGAKLTFHAADTDTEKTVKTDAAGRYSVDLPPGEYGLTVRKYGFEKQTLPPGEIVSESGTRTTRDIELRQDPSETGRFDVWDSLLLVGFVCRKVPESPAPNDDLTWEGG